MRILQNVNLQVMKGEMVAIMDHSQQQFTILSELSVHVKRFFIFLNFFSEIRVAFVRRNSHKLYQDYLSMSSTF